MKIGVGFWAFLKQAYFSLRLPVTSVFPDRQLFGSEDVSSRQEQVLNARDLVRLVTFRHNDNFVRQRHMREKFLTFQPTAPMIIGNRDRQIHQKTISHCTKAFDIRCRRPYHVPILTRHHRQFDVSGIKINARQSVGVKLFFTEDSCFNLHHAST